MLKKLFNALFPCHFNEKECADNLFGCKCGKGGSAPEAPQYQQPEWAAGIPEETLGLIRQGIGQQVAAPEEYGVASQALQGLLGYQPEQFQLPVQEIQDALAAQQAIQMEQYQQQIRPLLAAQGQLDSSYHTNLMGDYLQGQQAQTYGTTADLLTQQAQQNQQIQQWLPQFQAGIAGQLAGVGGQQANLDLQNIQLPYQTTIPALQQQYGQGLDLGDRETQQANLQYQQQLDQYNQQQQQLQGLYSGLGSLALTAGTGGIGALAKGGSFLKGAGSALGGLSGGASALSGLGGQQPLTGTYRYNPQWGRGSTPSGYTGSVYIPQG